jgi:hypothetical protein
MKTLQDPSSPEIEDDEFWQTIKEASWSVFYFGMRTELWAVYQALTVSDFRGHCGGWLPPMAWESF